MSWAIPSPHQFVGIGDHKRVEQRLQQALAEVKPELNVDWEFVPVDETEALVIDVPRGSLFPHTVDGIAVIREHERVVPVDAEDILRRAEQQSHELATSPL